MKESDLNELLARSEETLSDMKILLHPTILTEDQKITIRLMEGAGISRIGGTRLILLYYFREGRIPLAHELTHVLMGNSSSRLMTDGLAVYCQERFNDFDFPNFFTPVKVATLGNFRRGSFLSLTELQKGIGFNGETRRLAYLEAGSFARYLIDRYGYPMYRQVYYSNDFSQSYGSTLVELEREWLESLWRTNLLVSSIYLVIGILCLSLISASLTRASFYWFLIVAVSPIALAVLDLCLYASFPSKLALAIQALTLFIVPFGNKIPLKWSRMMVWILGLSLLAYFEINSIIHIAEITLV
jgi:hypothetical protein